MAIRPLQQGPGFVVRHDQPLLGISLQEEGQEVVCYFAEEGQADATIPQSATQEALRLQARHDLDWTRWQKGCTASDTRVRRRRRLPYETIPA